VVFMYLGSILWFFVNIADFIPTENCIAFCVHNVWLWDIYPDDVKRDPDDALYSFFHVAEIFIVHISIFLIHQFFGSIISYFIQGISTINVWINRLFSEEICSSQSVSVNRVRNVSLCKKILFCLNSWSYLKIY
jgi:hypothetical protein